MWSGGKLCVEQTSQYYQDLNIILSIQFFVHESLSYKYINKMMSNPNRGSNYQKKQITEILGRRQLSSGRLSYLRIQFNKTESCFIQLLYTIQPHCARIYKRPHIVS